MHEDRQQLFEFAILHHPTPTKEQYERGVQPDSTVVVPPKVVLAQSQEEVFIKAAKEIPEEHMNHLKEVQIAVRPFANLDGN